MSTHAHDFFWGGGAPPPPKMSQVDDNKLVRGKVFKRCDLALICSIWRALAGMLTGAICCQRTRKSLRPERRSSLETGALLDGALSRYLRSECGASL